MAPESLTMALLLVPSFADLLFTFLALALTSAPIPVAGVLVLARMSDLVGFSEIGFIVFANESLDTGGQIESNGFELRRRLLEIGLQPFDSRLHGFLLPALALTFSVLALNAVILFALVLSALILVAARFGLAIVRLEVIAGLLDLLDVLFSEVTETHGVTAAQTAGMNATELDGVRLRALLELGVDTRSCDEGVELRLGINELSASGLGVDVGILHLPLLQITNRRLGLEVEVLHLV